MIGKISRYYHTLKYLKTIQIRYRFYYLLRNKIRSFTNFKYSWNNPTPQSYDLKFIPSIESYHSCDSNLAFSFLNLEKKFDSKIDWNFAEYGKLWTYNLTYFEYLNQEKMSPKLGQKVIHDFISNIDQVKDGLEPFPLSLRIINWVKFLAKQNIKNPEIDKSLFAQSNVLANTLEYHLLGNHLLENGFAMLFSAFYFKEEKFLKIAEAILFSELDEQILDDGAHFELTPMYHQLMLFRVLDCINLIENNSEIFEIKNKRWFSEKAELMLGWLKQITWENGDIPALNDSTQGIAPSTKNILDLGERLGLTPSIVPLASSGYRKFKKDNYELIIDIGDIGPTYIPAHSHSDTFNFLINREEKPLIVDSGISTYEKNNTRKKERSTSAHNTVLINGQEQSDVWGGFRVGQRARVFDTKEETNYISASHDGYKSLGIIHHRSFTMEQNKIVVEDSISGKTNANGQAFIHFHPSVQIDFDAKKTIFFQTGNGRIDFENFDEIEIGSFPYSVGFNKTIPSKKIVISFHKKLVTTISL